MNQRFSLHARVIAGSILWTIGLFAVTAIAATSSSFRNARVHLFILGGLMVHRTIGAIAAAVCMVLGFWQVRKGLAALNELRGQLSAVRDGRSPRVIGIYPTEVQPLVDDLNALLTHREAAVARAISKAGDLAHGLKTPLAVLTHDGERARTAGHHELADAISQQVDKMRRQIDYHLAHARAAAAGATPGARSTIAEPADAIARTMRRLYTDRQLAIDVVADPSHAVRVQREDLEEILGNLLDNACKWTRSRVLVESHARERTVEIVVEDDGAGVEAALRDEVLRRGVRADEAAPGSGLGLSIVRDLVDLYGGSIALETSRWGGLRARLELPRA